MLRSGSPSPGAPELYRRRYVAWTLLAVATSVRRSSIRRHLRWGPALARAPPFRTLESVASHTPPFRYTESIEGCGSAWVYMRIRHGGAACLAQGDAPRFKQKVCM